MGKMYQIQTAFAASFSCFVMGLLNVWPSYTIKQYTAINGTILNSPMSEFESSFLGSAPSLGAIFGTAVVSITIDNLGRKKGGVIIALPAVLSWAIIDISSSSLPILAARFLGGISGGAGLVFAPIFISEVVEDSIRGMLASTPMVCYCSGALISYLLGWFSSYHIIIRFNIVVCVLSAVLLMLVKESPVFLLKKNREEDARAAIAHYRGATTASKIVLEELSRLKLQVMPGVEMITVTAPDEEAEKEELNPNHDISPQEQSQKQPAWKTLFVSPSSRRAFTVVGTVLTLQVLMGMIAVQVYAKDLFAAAAPDLIPDLCSVLLAVILLAGCTVAGAIADKAGRRPLQVSSCVMSGACMVFMGVLLQTSFAPPWLTAVMVLLFCLSFNFGAGTVPYVLIAEVFVPEVQGIASTILIEWVWFLNFFIIQVFPTLLSLMGLHGAFYVFGIVGFVNAVVSYYIVPETKGLSNEQVQDAFRRKQ